MTLRQLPGALILGLLASLVAHTLGYGDGHIQGGAYHDGLVALATLGGAGLLAAATIAAFFSAGPHGTGSVIAARIRSHVPGLAAIGASALGWYAAAESLEPTHATASSVLMAALLALATIVIGFLAALLVRFVAAIAMGIFESPFANRQPLFARRAYVLARVPSARAARRPVSRPPPVLM